MALHIHQENSNCSINYNYDKQTDKCLNKNCMSPKPSIVCRICYNCEQPEKLISPCLCKGTLAYVHRSCLEYWLSQSGIMHCELCMYRFPTEYSLRYRFCESLRIWYRHPNNRGLLRSDVMVCSLLTFITLGIIAFTLFGLNYYVERKGGLIGISKFWTNFSVSVFLIIILLAYVFNCYFIIKAQIEPWYSWWQSFKCIHLVIPNQIETFV